MRSRESETKVKAANLQVIWKASDKKKVIWNRVKYVRVN